MSIYDNKELMKFFNEPDFHDTCAFGLPIHMRRNWAKAWCGYVGVPTSHPFYGKSFSDRVPADRNQVQIKDQSPIAILCEALQEEDGLVSLDILLDCPGGITYGRNTVPYGGELIGWWYLGFDCNHYNDLSPRDIIESIIDQNNWRSGIYRSYEFVLNSCRKLAEQLSEFN